MSKFKIGDKVVALREFALVDKGCVYDVVAIEDVRGVEALKLAGEAREEYRYSSVYFEVCIVLGSFDRLWVNAQIRLRSPDLSDWKIWARTPPGCCACGISKQDCSYHRG